MIKVWDPVVRLFHWTVVLGCVLDLFVLEEGGPAHELVGYVVVAAVSIRITWGFMGPRYARFAEFVPTPLRLRRYLSALIRGREPRYWGHNPAGAVMMLVLIMLLVCVSVTGWMMNLDVFWGVEWVEKLHGGVADAILVLGLIHAAAAVFESWRHRENLIWSMVTGRKRL